MALAPLAQRCQYRGELLADGGEHVLVARRVFAVSPPFYDPGLFELAQPQRQGLPRGAGVDLDVFEPVDAKTQLPQYEQAPALSDDLKGVSDGADPGSPQIGRFAFLTHLATVAPR